VLDATTGQHRLDLPTSDTRGSPAIDENNVYVADSRGVMTAVDWSKSELPFEKTAQWVRTQLFWWKLVDTLPPPKGFVWSFRRFRQSFVGTPTIGEDNVYVASNTGAVFALSRSDGRLEWTFKSDERIGRCT
jgi:outer membrane protein assembly factor BamB